MKRNAHFGRVWEEISKLVKGMGLNERMEGPLLEASFGYKIRNSRYRAENEISDVVASRDLKRLCEAELLIPIGEKRGRYYIADKRLQKIQLRTRDSTRSADPYKMVKDAGNTEQLSLFTP